MALVRDNQIEYANQALGEHMGFKDYLGGVADIEYEVLKMRLENLKVERVFTDKESNGGGDEKEDKSISAWNMVKADSKCAGADGSIDKGGPCKLQAHGGSDSTEMHRFLSMNAVDVTLCGKESKLFVVRDMTPMVSLQTVNYTKHLFNCFTEKVLLQI